MSAITDELNRLRQENRNLRLYLQDIQDYGRTGLQSDNLNMSREAWLEQMKATMSRLSTQALDGTLHKDLYDDFELQMNTQPSPQNDVERLLAFCATEHQELAAGRELAKGLLDDLHQMRTVIDGIMADLK